MSPSRPRIYSVLICDDDNVSRKILRAQLTKLGYNIVGEAKTGVESAVLFEKYLPDVTLLDYHMPHGTGLTILKLIQEIQPGAKVVLLTGETDADIVVAAQKLGAVDYVSKVSQPDRLIGAIRKATKSLYGDLG